MKKKKISNYNTRFGQKNDQPQNYASSNNDSQNDQNISSSSKTKKNNTMVNTKQSDMIHSKKSKSGKLNHQKFFASHFVSENETNYRCTLCSTTICIARKSNSNTKQWASLGSHMQYKHSDVYWNILEQNDLAKRNDQQQLVRVHPVAKDKVAPIYPSLNQFSVEEQKSMFHTMFAACIVEGGASFTFGETPSAKSLFGTFVKNHTPPSASTVKRSITKMAEVARVEIKSTLAKCKEAAKEFPVFSVGFDMWKNQHREHVLGLVVQFIDVETCKTKHQFLDLTCYEEKHSSFNLAKWISTVLTEYLGEETFDQFITSLCTDNASNVFNVANLMKVHRIGCFSHTLQLAINDALSWKDSKNKEDEDEDVLFELCETDYSAPKRVVETIQKCSMRMNHLHRSQGEMLFKTWVKKKKLSGVPRLSLLVSTRWNSLFNMVLSEMSCLECNIKEFMESYVVKRKLSEKLKEALAITPEHHEIIYQMASLLKPVDTLNEKLQRSGISMAEAYVEIATCLDDMKILYDVDSHGNENPKLERKLHTMHKDVRQLYANIVRSLEKRFDVDVLSDQALANLVLSPELCKSFFDLRDYDEDRRCQLIHRAKEYVLSKVNEKETPTTKESILDNLECSQASNHSIDAVVHERRSKKVRFSNTSFVESGSIHEEWDRYISCEYKIDVQESCVFWQTAKVKYPRLFEVWCLVQGMMCSTSMVESHFSMSKRVMPSHREGMTFETQSALVLLKSSGRLGNVDFIKKCIV